MKFTKHDEIALTELRTDARLLESKAGRAHFNLVNSDAPDEDNLATLKEATILSTFRVDGLELLKQGSRIGSRHGRLSRAARIQAFEKIARELSHLAGIMHDSEGASVSYYSYEYAAQFVREKITELNAQVPTRTISLFDDEPSRQTTTMPAAPSYDAIDVSNEHAAECGPDTNPTPLDELDVPSHLDESRLTPIS